MSQPPLRFLHSGDFHLERPLSGVADVPSHLRELFLDAPYIAARRVFEAALAEGVDALLLSGDLVQVESIGTKERFDVRVIGTREAVVFATPPTMASRLQPPGAARRR